MQKKIQQVEIGLASPKQIREWAERELPTGELVGEVTSWETVNYKTLKPEPNGLFCQRIFGPIVDYTCACAKKSTKVYKGFCLKCGVEKTTSRVRRYRLGYIKLKQPVVHTLYASQRPSPLTRCLNWSNKRVQAVTYATEFCKLPPYFTNFLSFFVLYRILFQAKNSTYKKSINQFPTSRFFYPSKIAIFTDSSLQNKNIFSSEGWSKRLFKKEQSFKIENSKMKSQKKVTLAYLKRECQSSSLSSFFSLQKNCVLSRSKTGKFLNETKNRKPKLFRPFSVSQSPSMATFVGFWVSEKKNIASKKYLRTNKIHTDFFVYGITYDATWAKVDKIQEFLFYISEQPKFDEMAIPYYGWKKILKDNIHGEIPRHKQYYPIQTGGFVFQKIFCCIELVPLFQQVKLHDFHTKRYIIYLKEKLKWYEFGGVLKEKIRILRKLRRLIQDEQKLVKRLNYFRDFYTKEMNLAWMILSYLPVLSPDLRPIMSIQGELIVSDINSLYRKVLTRNKRIHSLTQFKIFDTALSGSWASWCYNLRQVQESVDSLFKTGSVESGKTTKSLLDSLKGKKGRFRQHLLGKRVDYSGRSVIVVGPALKIYECGLPKQMALELFQPFLIQKLRNKRIALTTTAAKTIITQKKPIIWSLLAEIMKNHPVLLNRAPTLHRLGIQAFLPRLVEGKAILLHPLVCPAFNADFDGDQMAVHIPLGAASRSEALQLMWSRNHILAPASGQPLLVATQDMVLGCYYLTTFKISNKSFSAFLKGLKIKLHQRKNLLLSGYYFSTLDEVQHSYEQGCLETHTPIWVRWFGKHQNLVNEQESKVLEQPIEFRIDVFGKSDAIFHDRHIENIKESSDYFSRLPLIENAVYLRTTPGRVFFHTKFLR